MISSRLKLERYAMIHDRLLFLKEGVTAFTTTGSVAPSSRWAARELTSAVRSAPRPCRILEAGPGTGPVSIQILKEMREGDSLTLCEINPRFMEILKARLQRRRDYKQHEPRISYFLGPVQNLPEVEYDRIVCGIPFYNLRATLVAEIFNKFESLSHSNTELTFFSYVGIREISRVAPIPKVRERIKQVSEFFDALEERFPVSKHIVWANLTPICVYNVKIGAPLQA